MTVARSVFVACACLALAGPVAAQSPAGAGPAPVAEATAGWAGFGDEGLIQHTILGAAARVPLGRRVSVGPELQYLVGPGSDRDLIVTGNLTVDLLAATATRPRRTTPYLVLGGGLFRHSDRFGATTFSSTEGAVTGGLGVRAWISERVYLAGDARLGWEPHIRLAASVGVALGR